MYRIIALITLHLSKVFSCNLFLVTDASNRYQIWQRYYFPREEGSSSVLLIMHSQYSTEMCETLDNCMTSRNSRSSISPTKKCSDKEGTTSCACLTIIIVIDTMPTKSDQCVSNFAKCGLRKENFALLLPWMS